MNLLILSALSTLPLDSARPVRSEGPHVPRVLVYTVSAGFEHDVVKRESPEKLSLVETALVELGKSSKAFDAVPTRDASEFEREKIVKYDLVFLYTTGELPFSEAQKTSFFDWVDNGGALAGAHCAADTFYKEARYGEMIGAYFDGHPWHEKVTVKVEDKDSWLVKHLGSSFEITDEIYQFKTPYDRSKLHVLLSLDTATLDLKKDGVHRADKDFAVSWTKEQKKGRVFYTSLGHRPEVWKDERYLKHLENGFLWAMRREPKAADAAKPAPGNKDEKKDAPKKLEPELPPGFSADLVAEAPEILWPSAIHCLDDGSVLVGEDRMDMPGPSDKPIDRLMRFAWKSDGSYARTEFARDLYAVMGLEEKDGTVFVMNMPHLTALRDTNGDGVADERSDIVSNLGPDAPGWPGGFNDHIVSGLRFGMDGWLYVAVGDKGIPRATGKDGSEITLQGGGVVRLRPDGTKLEIVARGLRNILDVAIDETGEMFTYDNTDDGLGWWTRVTHVRLDGAYGYPWDYTQRPDAVLPCMTDYGGGSPCGGLIYREAAWPKEYRGSWFHCEWAKGSLRRMVLAPKGGTFEIASAENFMSAGNVPAFKPFDVIESPDGRFLYISDWAFEGWLDKKEVGRLWRVRRSDDDPKVPSVARALPTTTDGLLKALENPSFRHRLRAQRALESSDARDTNTKLDEYVGSEAPELARAHALAALVSRTQSLPLRVRRDSPLSLRTLERARVGAETALKKQIISAAAVLGSITYLSEFLRDSDALVRREAVTALGRSGTEWVPDEVLSLLVREPDAFVRFAIQRTLIERGWTPTVELRPFRDAALTMELEALRAQWTVASVQALADYVEALAPHEEPTKIRALKALADLARKPKPWDGKWWSIGPARSPRPAGELDWEGTSLALGTLRRAISNTSPSVRKAAVQLVRGLPDEPTSAALCEQYARESELEICGEILDALGEIGGLRVADLLQHVVNKSKPEAGLRARAIEAACEIRSPKTIQILVDVVKDERADPVLAVSCIDAIGRLKDPAMIETLRARARSGQSVTRTAAIAALTKTAGDKEIGTLEALLHDDDTDVRIAAANAIGGLRRIESMPELLRLVRDVKTRPAAIAALARTPDARALDAYLQGLVAPDNALRSASKAALVTIRDVVRAPLEALHAQGKLEADALPALREVYSVPQPIVSWKLLAPFERDQSEPDPLSVAADLAQRWKGHAGAEFGWKDVLARADDGFVDLAAVFTNAANVKCFGLANVDSIAERDATFEFGSDDMGAVWVNGALAHDFPGNRGWSAGEDKFSARLKPGKNTIVVRVGNATGQWALSLKVSSEPTGQLFESSSPSAPDDYAAFATQHPGDPARGFKIFRQESGPMCIRCHVVNGTGTKIGPDLSDVALKYGREELLSSVLEPSKRIAEGYKAVAMELDSGQLVFGMVKSETKDTLEVYDTTGQTKLLDPREVVERNESKVSIMPEGLNRLMTREEFADLASYLLTLRTPPAK